MTTTNRRASSSILAATILAAFALSLGCGGSAAGSAAGAPVSTAIVTPASTPAGLAAWAHVTSSLGGDPTFEAGSGFASVENGPVGTGELILTFATPLPDANYAATVTSNQFGFLFSVAPNASNANQLVIEAYGAIERKRVDLNAVIVQISVTVVR